MAKRKVKKGVKLLCVVCGREIIISDWGISDSILLCCGKPMKKKSPSLAKKVKAKLGK
jgi:hypothetical protein